MCPISAYKMITKQRRVLNMKRIQKGVWTMTDHTMSECPTVPQQDGNYLKSTISDETFDTPDEKKVAKGGNDTNESTKASAIDLLEPKRKLQPRRLDFDFP